MELNRLGLKCEAVKVVTKKRYQMTEHIYVIGYNVAGATKESGNNVLYCGTLGILT